MDSKGFTVCCLASLVSFLAVFVEFLEYLILFVVGEGLFGEQLTHRFENVVSPLFHQRTSKFEVVGAEIGVCRIDSLFMVETHLGDVVIDFVIRKPCSTHSSNAVGNESSLEKFVVVHPLCHRLTIGIGVIPPKGEDLLGVFRIQGFGNSDQTFKEARNRNREHSIHLCELGGDRDGLGRPVDPIPAQGEHLPRSTHRRQNSQKENSDLHGCTFKVFEYDRHILPRQDGHRRFQLQALPEPTEEEKAEAVLYQAKVERAEKVANLTVEVDGMVFNADETSQDRIARVLAAAQTLGYEPETTTQLWVLADDTYANVTIAQLAKVLEKAGKAQTDVWVLPSYEPFKN